MSSIKGPCTPRAMWYGMQQIFSSSPVPPIVGFLQCGNLIDARASLAFTNIEVLYEPFKGKNVVQLLLESQFNERSYCFLDEIIEKTTSAGKIELLKNAQLFVYALRYHKEDWFQYLLNNHEELLEDAEVKKCLELCVGNNLDQACKTLCGWCDVNNKKDLIGNVDEKSPLQTAIQKKRLAIFGEFIDCITLTSRHCTLLLHKLAADNKAEFLQRIWKNHQLEVLRSLNETTNSSEDTALHVAARKNNAASLRVLLSFSANYEFINRIGKRPFEVAPTLCCCRLESRELLDNAEHGLFSLVNGFSENQREIQQRRERGLQRCLVDGRVNSAMQLIQTYGIDPNLYMTDTNGRNWTSLMYLAALCRDRQEDFLQFIESINSRIDFAKTSSFGDNLVTFCLQNQIMSIAHHLLRTYPQININHANNDDETALTLAVKVRANETQNIHSINQAPILLRVSTEENKRARLEAGNIITWLLEKGELDVTRQGRASIDRLLHGSELHIHHHHYETDNRTEVDYHMTS